jgi:hypothetical protein
MEDIKDKLLKIAEENVNKKLVEEQKRRETQIEKEIEDVKFILELIEKKMIYKKIGGRWDNPIKYELITKEIFLEDYSKEEPKNSWSKKLQIKGQEYWDSDSYKLDIEVNGEHYYHIGYIINDFEEALKNKRNRIKYITDGLNDLEKDFEKLKNQEKNIKGFIEDYNAVNKSLNED